MKFDRLIEISKALKQNKKSGGRNFHICYALKGSKIICIGINNYLKSNPIAATYRRTKYNEGTPYKSGIHAEQQILGKLKHREDLRDITLVNVRIDNNDNLALSIPCPNCAWYLGFYHLKKIYYSTSKGFEKFKL